MTERKRNSMSTKVASGQGVSRRAFVAGGMVAAATLGLAACTTPETSISSTVEVEPIAAGEWIPVTCWSHCHGSCLLKAYMVDGTCLRLKSDEATNDSFDSPKKKACARGRSRRSDVFNPLRIRYPMKRASWQPGGGENAHGELRGKDEWERLTWEEALDMIADEMSRIKDTYGNKAFFGTDQAHSGRGSANISAPASTMVSLHFKNIFNLWGGYVSAWSTMSQGAYKFSRMLYGYGDRGWNNDRFDARKCEYAIMLGVNTIVSQDSTKHFGTLRPMVEGGTKFYFVDPMYTDTCASLGAEWVPIRPGTDKAMLLAMAYVMFTEDDPASNPIIDWEFLETHCIGYDADHMPEGVDPEDNFKDYVLGTYTGEPKTPEWAEEITSVSADKITEMALLMKKDNKMAFVAGIGPARCNNAEAYTQLHMIVGAMGGHMGQSGHMTSTNSNGVALDEQITLIKAPPWPIPQLPDGLPEVMHEPLIWNALLEGKYNYTGTMQSNPGVIKDVDIKCFYSYTMNFTHHTINLPKGIEFYKTLDLFVVNAFTYNDNTRYADFILPLITPWEEVPHLRTGSSPESCTLGQNVIEPLYEARSDYWIAQELCRRWGLDASEIYPMDEAMLWFTYMYGTEVIMEDGKTYEPLISFTEEEAAIFGPDATPRAEGRISYSELAKAGIYYVPRSEGDNYTNIGNKKFRDDPANNPIGSESGLLEFYSKTAPAKSELLGAGYSRIPGLPEYIPTVNGYESTFSDYEAGTKGTYPYQLYSPHYYRSAHSHYDNLPVMREAFIRPLFVNTKDAAAKGLADGDIVRLFNDNGSILRPVTITDRIVPGVVGLPHGGQLEVDEETGFCISGTDNWLTYPVTTGFGVDGYNTQVCDFEKWSGELLPDAVRIEKAPACQMED